MPAAAARLQRAYIWASAGRYGCYLFSWISFFLILMV